MTMELRSDNFEPGGPIPKKYSQEGDNVSPNLHWTGVPQSAQELALIVDDPDAPRDHPFVHWVFYRIPAGANRLPEGIPEGREPGTPTGAYHGDNEYGRLRYDGPLPPEGDGPHRYYFKLYALDEPLEVNSGLDKPALLGALEGHILEEAELIGTYER